MCPVLRCSLSKGYAALRPADPWSTDSSSLAATASAVTTTASAVSERSLPRFRTSRRVSKCWRVPPHARPPSRRSLYLDQMTPPLRPPLAPCLQSTSQFATRMCGRNAAGRGAPEDECAKHTLSPHHAPAPPARCTALAAGDRFAKRCAITLRACFLLR